MKLTLSKSKGINFDREIIFFSSTGINMGGIIYDGDYNFSVNVVNRRKGILKVKGSVGKAMFYMNQKDTDYLLEVVKTLPK